MYTIVVVLAFLFVTTFLGYLAYRNTKDSQDYLLAGRKSHPIVMALSYGATFISTSAIVGFGGLAATMGLGLLWLTVMNIFVGIFIAFVFFGKRTRRMGHILDAHTFPEFLSKRFESKFIQGFSGFLIIFCMPIYAASIIKGGANFIESYFNISYTTSLLFFVAIVATYVWMGGMKGVMYTDAFQGLVMFVSMVILLIFTYSRLGGFFAAHTQLTDLFSNPAVQDSIANAIKGGFRGWTSMPEMGSPMWWGLVSSIIAGVGIGVLAQPQLVVRFMTVKSDRELNRAVFSGGIFIMAMTGIAFVVGALTNAMYFNDTGKIAIVAAGGVNDKIIPNFISAYIPEWFAAIFLICMLGAAMSTLSSQFHTMGTASGRDLYEKTFGREGNTLFFTRGGMLIAIILSTAIAWGTTNLPIAEGIIAKFTSVFFELASATFLPAYIGALYLKKMPKKAAIGGMIAGAVSWFVWVFFVHNNASFFQICKLLTGKTSIVLDTSLAPLAHVGTTFVALPISILTTVIIWAIYKNDIGISKEHLDKCFQNTK
jgi:SSS family solute:Na+ symporter